MRKIIFVAATAVIVAGFHLGTKVEAATTYMEHLLDRAKQVDPDFQARTGLTSAANGGCSANALLVSIANGDRKLFLETAKKAQDEYKSAKESLDKVSGAAAFNKQIDVGRLKTIADLSAASNEIKTAGDLLRLIAAKAEASRAALERIQNDKAKEGDLGLVITNSADIVRLIAAFYGALSV